MYHKIQDSQREALCLEIQKEQKLQPESIRMDTNSTCNTLDVPELHLFHVSSGDTYHSHCNLHLFNHNDGHIAAVFLIYFLFF